jgi:hypothetical protein
LSQGVSEMKIVLDVPMSVDEATVRLASAIGPSVLLDPFAHASERVQYLGWVRNRRFAFRHARPERLGRNLYAVVRGRMTAFPGGGTRIEARCTSLVPTWLMLGLAGGVSLVFSILASKSGESALWLFVVLPWGVTLPLVWMNHRVLREEGPSSLAFLRAVLAVGPHDGLGS